MVSVTNLVNSSLLTTDDYREEGLREIGKGDNRKKYVGSVIRVASLGKMAAPL